jgi:hypothetical protein
MKKMFVSIFVHLRDLMGFPIRLGRPSSWLPRVKEPGGGGGGGGGANTMLFATFKLKKIKIISNLNRLNVCKLVKCTPM